jgi:hypothetical protein
MTASATSPASTAAVHVQGGGNAALFLGIPMIFMGAESG